MIERIGLVKFLYLDLIGNVADREFTAWCDFLPRVGDRVFPGRGIKGSVVVRHVAHRFVRAAPGDEEFQQVVTVVLVDLDAPASDEFPETPEPDQD